MTFVCGWLINPDMPDWLKPKTSKVIIKPNYAWQKPSSTVEVHIANACGPRIPGKTLQWMKTYALQNQCNFLCNEPEREGKMYTGKPRKFGVGSDEFVADVAAWVEAGHEFYIGPSQSRLVVGDKIFMHKS